MRLTKEFREELIGRALVHAFGAREKAHDEATTALADAMYAHEYSAHEKNANKLPQGWVSTSTHLQIKAAGFAYNHTRHGVKHSVLKMSKQRRTPGHSPEIAIGGAHPLNDQAQAVAEEYAAIKRDKEALRAKLSALVYSVTTIARLREAWPECEQFLPEAAPRPTTALVPVELVPELNAALGIKAKGA